MKIKSIKEKGDFMLVVTDHKIRNEFVYKKDKFANKEALIKEIEKSVSYEKKRKEKKDKKFKKVKEN